MKISIITPSFNSLHYLKLCSASIADQAAVEFEHIVVDGASTDGTVEWLRTQPGIQWISEKDNGMYDAVNKGMKLATGDIIAYLNADEQYLPGTLSKIERYFISHSGCDVVFGDFYAVNNYGDLVSYRKSFVPRESYLMASTLYSFTCTMFFRRKLIEDGHRFDISYKGASDKIFILGMFQRKYAISHMREYLSTFTVGDHNLSNSAAVIEERKRFVNSLVYPSLWPVKKIIYKVLRIIEKIIRGCYFNAFPIEYKLYTFTSLDKRTTKIVTVPNIIAAVKLSLIGK